MSRCESVPRRLRACRRPARLLRCVGRMGTRAIYVVEDVDGRAHDFVDELTSRTFPQRSDGRHSGPRGRDTSSASDARSHRRK